jgi:hypothetical protein
MAANAVRAGAAAAACAPRRECRTREGVTRRECGAREGVTPSADAQVESIRKSGDESKFGEWFNQSCNWLNHSPLPSEN